MTTTIKQIPGRLNLVARSGDDLSYTLTFSQGGAAIDMSSGYTFAAAVDIGGSEVDFTVDDTDFNIGVIVLTMTDTLSAGITPGATYSWYLDRTDAGVQRRWLAGDFYAIEFKE